MFAKLFAATGSWSDVRMCKLEFRQRGQPKIPRECDVISLA